MSEKTHDPDTMPFVAPCRTLTPGAPLRWLRLGYADFRRALPQSMGYGLFMAAMSVLVCWLALAYGSVWFLLAMVGGFIFLAPLTCIGLYALSAQLERGQPPSFRRALREALQRHIGNELTFALVLLVIFLVWARAGAAVSIFFPVEANPSLRDLATYLGIGTAVGAVFAGITFSASAFSLPMLLHRRVDAITGVVTSVNAVLRNKLPMAIWLAIVVVGLLVGVATAFVGLVVILPVIGHAAWHGYLETIDASAFPRHENGITAVPRKRADGHA